MGMKRFPPAASAVVLGALAIGLAATGCARIDTYEAGVKKNRFTGAVGEDSYGQGLRPAILSAWTVYDLREIQYPRGGASEPLQALTSDQLSVRVDAAFRYRLQPDRIRDLYVTIGPASQIHDYVYNTYRSAARDAVSEIAAAELLSRERAGIAQRIQELMTGRLAERGILVTDFFVREIVPPESIQQAIEEKLAREQQVQAEQFQTQVVVERANQRRAEAEGIRDAQRTIAESLDGVRGQRYLYWRYLEMLGEVGQGDSNVVIAPTEGGVPVFISPQ